MNSFRYLGKRSAKEVDEMTLCEYHIAIKASALKALDHERDIHLQAYLNMSVQATKQRGKKSIPVYPRFGDFFNYDERKNEILGVESKENERENKIRDLVLRANMKGGSE